MVVNLSGNRWKRFAELFDRTIHKHVFCPVIIDWNPTVPQTHLIKEFHSRLSATISAVLNENTMDVIGLLVDNAVINLQEKDEILAMSTTIEKALKLLTVMSDTSKSMKQFDRLLNVFDLNEHRGLIGDIKRRFGEILVDW